MEFYKPQPAAKRTIQGIIVNQLGLAFLCFGAANGSVAIIVVGAGVYLGGGIALLIGVGNFLGAHDDMAMHAWNTIRLEEQAEEDRRKLAGS